MRQVPAFGSTLFDLIGNRRARHSHLDFTFGRPTPALHNPPGPSPALALASGQTGRRVNGNTATVQSPDRPSLARHRQAHPGTGESLRNGQSRVLEGV
jgi:hypothetical protein